MRFRLPVLPWATHDLEPFLSSDTIETHYFGHHQTYIDKVNELSGRLGLTHFSLEKIILNHDGAIFNNAAQAWNHTFYWYGLTARPTSPDDCLDLAAAIEARFGSLQAMGAQFLECASHVFGSGWTWLVSNDRGELEWINTRNADNPLRFEETRPLWVCDMWEHAYYLDFRTQRKAYAEGLWRHINWDFVAANFTLEHMPNMSRLMSTSTEAEASVGATL